LELISIPFAFAAVASQYLGWQNGTVQITLCAAAAAFSFICRFSPASMVVLYLSLGCFCGGSAGCCKSFWDEVCGLSPAVKAAEWMRSAIDRIPYSRESSQALVKALLTGDRSDLGGTTVKVFREAGASHILALSGLHLGLIHLIVRKLSSVFGNSPLSRRARALTTSLAAGFYTIMTGASPSTVRALLFICIGEWSALSTFRKGGAGRALLLALTIQIALSPGAALTPGFQLSYLAMCGIIFLLPAMHGWYPADGKLKKFDPMRMIWNAASLSISCQIFTAPLAWALFGTFPKYFLLTNVLVMPLTSAIMIVSLLTLAASALGCCPLFLVMAGEFLIRIMTGSLELICRI